MFWIESVGDEEVAWFNVGGEKAIKITLYLGWSWVEWVWRGYILGYKTPVLAFSGDLGFS